MANSLLDFVMSLVRDPDAAARYAADPAAAIADAHLTGVTSADVNNLIPMVADSLSGPLSGGVSGFGAPAGDANVWASGAATAAFDAFDAHPPVPGDIHPVIADAVQHASGAAALIADPGAEPVPADLPLPDASSQFIDAGLDHIPTVDPAADWADHPAWDHPHIDDTHGTVDHQGFDLF